MCSQCEALESYKFISANGTYDERRERAGKYHPRHESLCEDNSSDAKQPMRDTLIDTQSEPQRFYKKTPIPPEIRWRVWERDNFTCQNCGSRKHLAVDHILAESKGGMMVLSNLQTLCGNCHTLKTLECKDYASPGRKSLGITY